MAPPTHTAFELFKKELSSAAVIVTPKSEDYKESIRRWSASAERDASLIVYPTTPADVSAAVLFAQANNLELAVKGGGHSSSASSSTEGGLCIDLEKLRKVSVDVEKQTVTAQGGALWADVDIEAEKYGLACVGGTVNHTGVGGLTLGGGYGHLTGLYGLVIDNLLELEFVLADGSIVTASSTQNTDLFWAARGAGANFGVATSFTFKAHKHPEIWGGVLVFAKSELDDVVNFANYSFTVKSGKHAVIFGIASPPPLHTPIILTALSYHGTAEEAVEFFTPLLSLPSLVNTNGVMPYRNINTLINDGMAHGLRRTLKGSVFSPPLALATAHELFSEYEAFQEQIPDAVATVILFEFWSYSKILEVKQTDTAFANRGAYGNLLFAPGWTDEKSDAACREWNRKMVGDYRKIFQKWQEEEGDKLDDVTSLAVGEYGNYDGVEGNAKVLFGVNYARLRELKKVHDPENVFCKGPNLLL